MLSPVSSCILSSALVLGAPAGALAGTPAPVAAPASAPALSEADAKRLHKLVEDWLLVGQVPQDHTAELWADQALGVVVTLRLEGVEMGRGSAVRPDLAAMLAGQNAGPVDLVPLLKQAAGAAFLRTEGKLSESSSEKNLLAAVGKTLCVDVQVAHRPEPVLLGAAGGEGGADVFSQIAPGWHGLALCAAGDRAGVPSLAWPGTELAQGIPYDTTLRHLLEAQKIAGADIKKLGRPDGARLHTFEVFHVVRPRPELPPMTLVRGTVLVPENAITVATLRILADRTATHLLTKVTDSGTLRGGYRPAEDTWQPAIATPAETALAAYALVRASSLRFADDPKDELAIQCLKAASSMAKKLAPEVSDASAAPQPLAAAFLLLALTDAPGGADRDWRDRLAADLMALDAGADGYAIKTAGTAGGAVVAKPVGRTTGAIITCALAAWYERTRDAKAEVIVRRQLEQAFANPQELASPETAYWVAMAERRAGLPLAATDKDPIKGKTVHADRLNHLGQALEALRAKQISRAPANGPADVVGGFALNPSGLPLPTWQGSFVMALWGELLREPQAVAVQQRPAHLRGISRGARFMAQLIETPASCFACRNPGAAVGGVRGAPWDMRLDTQPAAMTLLALIEVVEGLKN